MELAGLHETILMKVINLQSNEIQKRDFEVPCCKPTCSVAPTADDLCRLQRLLLARQAALVGLTLCLDEERL